MGCCGAHRAVESGHGVFGQTTFHKQDVTSRYLLLLLRCGLSLTWRILDRALTQREYQHQQFDVYEQARDIGAPSSMRACFLLMRP
eukprot:11989875-Prorocentrum_lima.AAC.1